MLGYCVKISKIHTLTNAFNPIFQFQCRGKLTSKHEERERIATYKETKG